MHRTRTRFLHCDVQPSEREEVAASSVGERIITRALRAGPAYPSFYAVMYSLLKGKRWQLVLWGERIITCP